MKEILFPVARMIGGSPTKLYQATDNLGNPKLKKGTTEPLMRINFGIAIAKVAGQDWKATPWGADMVAEGMAGYPNGEYNSPTFAWKLTDGDSAIPNKKGNVPNQQVGYPAHWVLWFSQAWAAKICDATGQTELTDPDAIVPGYFVQVLAECKDNAPSESPGVYLNPKAVALSGYGERIAGKSDVDTTSVGFGGQPLPPGASATPVGMAAPPASMSPPPPGPTGAAAGAALAAAVIPAATPPTPGVTPAPDFLNPPAPVRTMTAKAAGATYESFIGGGWTDARLIANGYMLA